MQNIDLSSLNTRQRFTINNDENRVLELDVTDLKVLDRFNASIDTINAIEEKVGNFKVADEADTAQILQAAQQFAEIDAEMRKIIDYIFDSNVCEVCVPSGSMFDPIKGKLRYQLLIEVLSGLYEANLDKELEKLKKNVKKHTDKYVKKDV